jgi:hypothetical protein
MQEEDLSRPVLLPEMSLARKVDKIAEIPPRVLRYPDRRILLDI